MGTVTDIINEDYRGCWLLVCEESGTYTASIDRQPFLLPQAFSSHAELLFLLQRSVDVEKARTFDLAAGQPILLT